MTTNTDPAAAALEVGQLVCWADQDPTQLVEVGIVTYIDEDYGIGLLFSDGDSADTSSAKEASELTVLDESTLDPYAVASLREMLPNYTDPEA